MVSSIKDDGNGGDSIISSHANHRGDVIARSNESRSLTSFALYEAYGTRPYEWGDDPDPQKANTKEEESDLGLLNEGMRFRDLEMGVFLTRDPIGFGDGPNVYCYVHCNPITKFDAFGLWEYDDDEDDKTLTDDGNYNVYEEGEGDFEDPDAGLLVEYNNMQDLLDNAKDGYVTLLDGRQVGEGSFRNALESNNMSIDSSAKDTSREAYKALQNGHISRTEADAIKTEVQQTGKIVSLGEHWNAREVLNRIYTDDSIVNPDNLVDPSKSIYHGPNRGKGCKKYVDRKTGAELVFDAQSNIERRAQYKGTFNYGTGKEKDGGNGFSHGWLDVKPYYDSSNSYADKTPYADRVAGPGTVDTMKGTGVSTYNPYKY